MGVESLKLKKNKKFSGMTLVEIILSMFIFGVISLIMVQIGVATNSTMFNTNHMNNKTNAESPIANVRDVNALKDGTGNIKEVTVDGKTFTAADIEQNVAFTVDGKSYSAKRYLAAVGSAESVNNTNTNMNGHLHFYVVDTTEASTEAETT